MHRALLFDLDDTLMAQDASDDAALLATCERAGRRSDTDPQDLAHAVRRRARGLWRHAPTFPYCDCIGISSIEGLWARFRGDDSHLRALRAWAPIYRCEAWSRALAEYGVDDASFAEELAATFGDERRARHAVFPDVEPALQELREGHRLALVTNGAPDLQREKLRASGLEPYFDAVVVSGEIGVGKPDPRIFALALELLHAHPAAAAMVGDNPARDIAGAQGAGVRAIWIDRPGIERRLGDIRPDARIGGLDELSAIV